MEWAASPILYLLMLSLGIGLCLNLFISLKRDIFRLDRRGRRAEAAWTCAIADQRDASASGFEGQRQEIGELREELKQVAERVSLLTPSTPPATGVNLVKRTQVLQLARRGNRPDQIAACLQVPQNEVDLVLKVHRTIVKSF
jgi:hypothetical protein